MNIKDIIKEPVLIPMDATFRDAVALMLTKETNSLLVVNDEGALVGEISVSVLLDAIVPLDVNGDTVDQKLGTDESFKNAITAASDMPVRKFMYPNKKSIYITDSFTTIAGTAIAHQTAHLPIVDENERPIGVISRTGLKHILAKYLGIPASSD